MIFAVLGAPVSSRQLPPQHFFMKIAKTRPPEAPASSRQPKNHENYVFAFLLFWELPRAPAKALFHENCKNTTLFMKIAKTSFS